MASNGRVVSDPHSFDRSATGQRIQYRSIYSPRLVAHRRRTLSSGDPGLRAVLRQDHALLDAGDLISAPDSSNPYLELACAFYGSTAGRDIALGRNHRF